MDLVRLSIDKPVGVTVGVLLLVLFGLIGLTAIPVQLTPTVDRPEITVTTSWPGRSPQEIVDEITKEQEERLKNVTNLKTMTSVSSEGESVITLEFYIGTDVSRALQETSDALRQVPDYPDEVDEPTIKAADGASENAIAWIIIDVDPAAAARYPGFDITTLFDRLDKDVKPFLERIDGVAEVNIYGGREREVRVLADNEALALRGLNIGDVISALRGENTNVSAGSIAEGKRDYRVRVVGQFQTEEDVLTTVVAYRDGKPVYVRDVAQVEFGHTKHRGFVRAFGAPCIAMNCIRQSGANVVDVMEELRERLDEVRAEILPRLDAEVGPHLRLRQVYDETTYITSSIGLVTSNLWFGGAIAAVVLLLFLRSFVMTGVIALAIPISVVGTFLVLLGLGRTLNVVSLAGLAFAVGMVVDNAIVVLENIARRLQLGDPPMQAAYRGGREVWGAILASTLTTVAVFIPVLTIEEEAGQLFRDIAIAIVASVSLSLLVSITLVPAACSRWLRAPSRRATPARTAWSELFGLGTALGGLTAAFSRLLARLQRGVLGWTLRPAIVVAMAGLSIAGSMLLAPPLDYLPAGNRNLVFGGMLIPPGLSVEQMTEYAERIESQVLPYMSHTLEAQGRDIASLSPIPLDFGGSSYAPVAVENFFIGAFGGGMFAGATSASEQVVIPVGQLLTNAMNTLPDTFGGAQQSSLFGRGVGGGNTVNIEIMGPELARVVAAAQEIMFAAGNDELYGWGRVRPDPGNYNLGQPEVQVELTALARELGLSTRAVGTAVRGLFDGAYVDDFRLAGEAVDMVVLPSGGELSHLEQMGEIPVATPAGPVVPLDSLVVADRLNAPQAIQRVEELPAVKLLITPPPGMAVQDVIEDVSQRFIQPVRDRGLIDRTMRVRLEGTAAKLDEVQQALFGTSLTSAGSGGGASGAGRVAVYAGLGLAVLGLLASLYGFVRAIGSGRTVFGYGGVGLLVVLAGVGGALAIVGMTPELAMARFVWALLVTYLLMCALFESFVYPFVIMFTVPLAVVGGFGGLAIVHATTAADPTIATQQLDVLTMLGFVILVGVVVNNAILIVHQALNFMRGIGESADDRIEAMPAAEAISESVRTRVRPIFMSTLTSVGGMLPLVLVPGAGSEMYRGLGSVVVGGLVVSTVFTLVLVPLMLGLAIDMGRGVKELLRGRERGGATGGVAVA